MWAREILMTIARARVFLIEDMRNGGDPTRQHGVCEVKLSNGKIVYEGKRLSLADMRRIGCRDWRRRFPGSTFFIAGKDKAKLGYFWEHVYTKAKSGRHLGGVVNPDSGNSILDSEMQKLTALDFMEKRKLSEILTCSGGGRTRYSALWQADRTRIHAWRQLNTSAAIYAKERALINDVKEELRQGRRCQIYATYTGEKDVTRRS